MHVNTVTEPSLQTSHYREMWARPDGNNLFWFQDMTDEEFIPFPVLLASVYSSEQFLSDRVNTVMSFLCQAFKSIRDVGRPSTKDVVDVVGWWLDLLIWETDTNWVSSLYVLFTGDGIKSSSGSHSKVKKKTANQRLKSESTKRKKLWGKCQNI